MLIALMLAGRALVNLGAVPFVGALVAGQAFALVRSVDVQAVGVHVTVMPIHATPLQTLIFI